MILYFGEDGVLPEIGEVFCACCPLVLFFSPLSSQETKIGESGLVLLLSFPYIKGFSVMRFGQGAGGVGRDGLRTRVVGISWGGYFR